MNKLYCFTVLLFCALSINAQQTSDVQRCGHDHLMQMMEENHPGYQEVVQRSFDELKSHVSHSRNDTYVVKVAVHVVYSNADVNISDQRIADVMARLNEDYSFTNANAANVRSEFQGVVGSAGIQFDLDTVVRVSTTTLFEGGLTGVPDNVKQSTGGGSDAFDTNTYLNIWVCKIEGGALLGYAYPPTCAPNWPAGTSAPSPALEGVVVHYEAFDVGTTYSIQGQTINIEGRTLSHEVGHYMGLPHIWGNSILASFGIADCDADDGFADTPTQGLPSQFVCNPANNSCTDAGTDLPDMFENYMDYADETCMSAFTLEQIAVMRASLETCRNGIVSDVVSSNSEVEALANSVQLSPNPTNGFIRLTFDGEEQEDYVVTVRNLLGAEIIASRNTYGNNTMEMDLSSFANGVYFIEIRKGNLTAAKKVVLAK